jgi:hypothetical protein
MRGRGVSGTMVKEKGGPARGEGKGAGLRPHDTEGEEGSDGQLTTPAEAGFDRAVQGRARIGKGGPVRGPRCYAVLKEIVPDPNYSKTFQMDLN